LACLEQGRHLGGQVLNDNLVSIVLIERLGHNDERVGGGVGLGARLKFADLSAFGHCGGGRGDADQALAPHAEHEQVDGPLDQVGAVCEGVLVGEEPLGELQDVLDLEPEALLGLVCEGICE